MTAPPNDNGPALRLDDAEVEALGDPGFFVRDGFLGRAAALAARAAMEAEAARFYAAGVGRGADHQLDRGVRGDSIGWVDPDADAAPPPLAALHARFEALRLALARDAWLRLPRFDVQLARFPGDGTGYARHSDAFRGRTPGRARAITAIVYLNDAWAPEHGGALRLFHDAAPGGFVDVAPLFDRLVVFRCEAIEHEVRPAFAPRLAATAFYERAG